MKQRLQFSNIAILGSGTMGVGIAQVCALQGRDVILYDITEEIVQAGLERIRASIQKGVDLGKTPPDAAAAALARLTAASSLQPCATADLAIEAAPERLELKRELFARLDDLLPPHALLATNTSSLSVTAIAAATQRPEKVLGLHFFNPPILMKLVEVVRGDRTSEETLAAGLEFAVWARRWWSARTRRPSSSTGWRGRSTAKRCACWARTQPMWRP